MTDHTDHIQHTWHLTHPTHGPLTITLWVDDETVQVEGGDGESYSTGDGEGRPEIETYLLPKYQQQEGYTLVRDYAVNPPNNTPLPDDRPDGCPQCGQPTEYVPHHHDGTREGPAWMCTGCRWGQWSAGI
ncbi:hypothetical protein [Streptomyces hydrogenans]